MEIVFFRHGKALSIPEAGVSLDAERPLSEAGKEEVRLSAAALKAENFVPETIISSPFKRARETSILISDFFKLGKVVFLDSLANSSDIRSVVKSVMDLSGGRNALIVGHQPLLGIMSRLIAENDEIDLKPAGYAHIEVKDPEKPKGVLKSNFNI